MPLVRALGPTLLDDTLAGVVPDLPYPSSFALETRAVMTSLLQSAATCFHRKGGSRALTKGIDHRGLIEDYGHRGRSAMVLDPQLVRVHRCRWLEPSVLLSWMIHSLAWCLTYRTRARSLSRRGRS